MVWLDQAWSILEESVSNATNLTIFLFKCHIWHSHHRPTCTGNILLLKLFASFVQNNFVYEHIFRACSVALQQRRFTFCHDAVLRVIVSSIKSFLTLYQVSNTKVLYIKFIKADSRLPKTSKNSKKNQLWIAKKCTRLGSFVWSWVYTSNSTYNSYFTT